MGFSRQEYGNELTFAPPGDLPDPGIEFTSLTAPALAGSFFTTSTTWEAHDLVQILAPLFTDYMTLADLLKLLMSWSAYLKNRKNNSSANLTNQM